ncbi:glyoxalase [Agromyces subbeticus]|uniref:glyoxalase n=1 Tax=Agromyces subbeticus TaxID=293890 RepID=UPI0003B42407|nr:glyoxalase [Agromyces subbeticus]
MNTLTAQTTIESVTLEAADVTAAERIIAAFGLDDRIRVRQAADVPSSGFRGFTISLIVAQPSTVTALFDAAIAAGATALKPVEKSMWGYGGSLQAPDGTIWKVATSAKKNTGPATRQIEQIALLLGAEDVGASKRFYVDHGFTVGKSFGSYVEFASPASAVKLGLYKRRALAKDAGVDAEGSGSHRIAIAATGGPFTDPDGFAWEAASV